ncbi:MAG: DUF1553 domain-containing protein [Planctomycetaceae bacterium]
MVRLLQIGILSGLFATLTDVAGASVEFARDVAPILEQHCVRCHSSLSSKGDLSFETFADLKTHGYVVAGDASNSHLLSVITGNPPQMPKEGDPLSMQQINTIRQWIDEGAEWPDDVVVREKSKADASWWSLQPLNTVTLRHASASAIDDFVQKKLAEHGAHAADQADRRTLIRRLYFDMIGLPPSPDAVTAFVTDPDPQSYENVVDQLLASKHFGERWARHWLDVVHYADTHGFERDKLRDHAWPYRDYVIRAFNDDKPYDQFLKEQIAGDVISPDDSDAVIATGFLAAGPWDFVGQVETKSPELRRAARALDLDDMVTQVLTSTLAMTVNCARCHDHKLDPILQQDYYQLTAVFAGVNRADRDISATARQEFTTKKRSLEQTLSEVTAEIRRLEGDGIDLADIVGGGNGFGTGRKGLGIDVRTGRHQETALSSLADVKPGLFAASESKFVDGVFVPGNGETTVSSTGIVATELAQTSGAAWDAVRNGPVTSQFSTKLGGTDFLADGHSMIGLHANAGITFDLREIRAGDTSPWLFSTTAGYGGRTEAPSAEYRILLDGKVMAQRLIGRNDADVVQFEVPPTKRFLTLISTDGGNGYAHDQISFGDPRLTAVTPAPSENLHRITKLRSTQAQLQSDLKALPEPLKLYGVVASEPEKIRVLVRGNPEDPKGNPVAPGALGWKRNDIVFGDSNMPEDQRRLALANWITESNQALVARVIVNRLWHWHFGQGLVKTPSDFGYGGDRPSHPELLDWLAAELIRANWRLKHIHRLIVTSKTYQQRSHCEPGDAVDAGAGFDSDNRLLWRMNARRLEAEAIRDAVLAVTGKLNTTMYGPGYRDFDYEEAYAPIYTYKTADEPDLWRRSVYRFIVRTTPQQFLATLDCADPANFTPTRTVTTTALQSLAMFNNDFMLRQANYLAERLQQDAATVDQQVDQGFRLLFARSVTPEELQVTRPLVKHHGLAHLCRVLLNANEFVYVD